MARMVENISVPMARASILWLIGEYGERVPKIAPDVLRKMAKTFIQEVNSYIYFLFCFVCFMAVQLIQYLFNSQIPGYTFLSRLPQVSLPALQVHSFTGNLYKCRRNMTLVYCQ